MPADPDGLAKSTLPGKTVVIAGVPRVLKRMLGSGSYGCVFTLLGDQRCVVKCERMNDESARAQLQYEWRVYNELKGATGVARAFGFGEFVDADASIGWNVMCIERLGPTLEDCYRDGGAFGWEAAGLVGASLLSAMKSMHSRGMLHRDIKPHNIAFHRKSSKRNSPHEVCLFDMGLCKKYRAGTHHISYREGKSMCGTPRYASIGSHLGCELSRRDDLESVMYTLLYVADSRPLPWQGLKPKRRDAPRDERNKQIARVKIQTPIRQLMRKAPRGWLSAMRLVRGLGFEEEPDYSRISALLTGRHRSDSLHRSAASCMDVDNVDGYGD